MDMPSFLSFLVLVLILIPKATANASTDTIESDHLKGIIGAIVDNSSCIGKEERIAMEMAIKDFNDYSNQSLVLHIRNSQREPFQAALAAMDLINKEQAQAILGPHTWEEASLVAEVGSQNQIPVLSFADATPKWASEKLPYLLEASPNKYVQMKAIAAMVQSWEWDKITVIYEGTYSSVTGVIPPLFDSLREEGVEISHVLAVPPFTYSTLSRELEKLKTSQCRVFVVHLSLQLAAHLFERAKKMRMMDKDYVWITTDTITSLVHSINASTLSTMQGIVGVKTYLPENEPRFQDFCRKFRKRFGSDYPEEVNREPGIFAVQAYDAIWRVALAMRESKKGGKELLEKILRTDFDGLGGNVQYIIQNVAHIFQIINVVGKSYRELGFWSDGKGFSETVDDSANYSSSLNDLGQVIWPGGRSSTPRGWTVSASAKPLKIGVPSESIFKYYVKVDYDPITNDTSFSGFAIELFKATVELLPFYLPYNFLPFCGTYDDLVKHIDLKEFDAVVGDVAILAKRYEYAEFTNPYTEAGLAMIVPVRSKTSNKALLFMKPFTKAMWFLIGAITMYNGFVIWLIERNHCSELRGSPLNQAVTLVWLSFNALFSLHGGGLHSNLSRMTMVVWLFVALVITQTYTANLTSILTVRGLEPTVDSIESLQAGNAMIGCTQRSFVKVYLEEVLHFNPINIKNYTAPDDIAKDLNNREVAAIFLAAAEAKSFLARYCKGFTIAGPTFQVAGYGFAFPKGSSLLPSVNEALLEVSESGTLKELENSMIASQKCVEEDLDDDISSIGLNSFWLLFVLTGGTSTIALIMYVSHDKWKRDDSMLLHKINWRLVFAVMKHWVHRKGRISHRVSDVEIPTNFPKTLSLQTFKAMA